MFVIPLLPGLRDYYPSAGSISGQEKLLFFLTYMIWTASWLPGWEFLHRYVLVQAMENRWAGWGWVIVPISEGLYHLTKSPWECAGMILFSMLATYHTVKRGNMVVAFLVHLVIEMALPLFMIAF
jgi:membrane protease YdiL (CAAX protease family)